MNVWRHVDVRCSPFTNSMNLTQSMGECTRLVKISLYPLTNVDTFGHTVLKMSFS